MISAAAEATETIAAAEMVATVRATGTMETTATTNGGIVRTHVIGILVDQTGAETTGATGPDLAIDRLATDEDHGVETTVMSTTPDAPGITVVGEVEGMVHPGTETVCT